MHSVCSTVVLTLTCHAFAANGDEIVGNGKEQDYAWLAVVDTPEDLYMRPGRYMGPAIHR